MPPASQTDARKEGVIDRLERENEQLQQTAERQQRRIEELEDKVAQLLARS